MEATCGYFEEPRLRVCGPHDGIDVDNALSFERLGGCDDPVGGQGGQAGKLFGGNLGADDGADGHHSCEDPGGVASPEDVSLLLGEGDRFRVRENTPGAAVAAADDPCVPVT